MTAVLPAPAPGRTIHEFPLTDIQQAYWVGRSGGYALGGTSAHTYLEFARPSLDVPRFTRAWRRLIQRHAMLRATITAEGTQRILEVGDDFQPDLIDLRRGSEAERRTALERLRERLSLETFADEVWPLFSVTVCLLPDDVRIMISGDVIIADATSWQIVMRDLEAFYEGDADDDQPLDFTFRDYVAADAVRDAATDTDADTRYWREVLGRLPGPPGLPFATDPETIRRPVFRRHVRRLPAAAWDALRAVASREGLTPSAVLLAAYGAVLNTWSTTRECTINVTTFLRRPFHPDVPRLVGDFTSFVPVPASLPSGAGFATLAEEVQEQLFAALDHGELSGLRLVRAVGARPEEVPTQVVFTSLLNGAGDAMAAFRWLGELVHDITQTPQVWLDHQVFEDNGELVLNWDVVEGLFPGGMIEEMLSAYAGLLTTLAADSWSRPVDGILLKQYSAAWRAYNATDAPIPTGRLEDLFAAQVARDPAALAVVSGHTRLSYADLDRRADAVRAALVQRGVSAGELVPVVMDKGWQQIPAVLGILRAGGAYLPIDPANPAARRAWLLDDASARVALTQPWVNDDGRWPTPGLERLVLDDLAEGADEPPAAGPSRRATDLAYVIYTSGSTGNPKGVMIDHRGAVNTVLDVNTRLGLTPSDRVLGVSSLSFDLSVYDIFGTLAAGAALILPEGADARDPAVWARLMREHEVTVWNSAPPLMSLLADFAEGRPDLLPASWRVAMLSGDWIPVTLPDAMRALSPGLGILSLGGATEASIWSILYPVGDVDPGWTSIPYGHPMVNQSIHVLDEHLRPCPTWVEGDLWIGGIGVALGYWNNPDKTAAAFVCHPVEGDRRYRTGDRGRLLPTGEIEFLGRIDSQVKINGYRIELEEIEAALLALADVRAAVVHPVGTGERRTLSAWVVPATPGAITPAHLTSALRERLPAHMVPAAVDIVDALPLTANGKIDRAALASGTAPPHAPPLPMDPQTIRPLALVPDLVDRETASSGTEDVLATVEALVTEALGRTDLTPDTDLLAAGASSIDLVRLANRLERTFGTRPSVRELFALTSITRIAAHYAGPENRSSASAYADPSSVPPVDDTGLLLDPADRDQFKCRRASRRLLPGKVRHPLASADPDPVTERVSTRAYSDEPLPLATVADLLASVRELTTEPTAPLHRSYASAGAAYGLQVYAVVRPGSIAGLAGGTYYHDPLAHALVRVGDADDPLTGHAPANAAFMANAGVVLHFVGDHAALTPLYGELSRDFLLIEAGSVAQVLAERATRLGLGTCLLGSMDTAGVMSSIGAEPRHEWLLALVCGTPAVPATEPATANRAVVRRVPTTDLQQAYLVGETAAFGLGEARAHVVLDFAVNGLDVEAFETAWRTLVRRHPLLRAVPTPDGTHLEVLETAPAWSAHCVDLRAMTKASAEASVAAARERLAAEGPTTDSWPLFEVEVHQGPRGSDTILLSLSLLIVDATSVGILIDELAGLYADPTAAPAPLPLPPLAPADDAARTNALAHWRTRVTTLPPPPALPVTTPAPLGPPRFTRRTQRLDPGTWTRLKAGAAAEGLTGTALLIAAYTTVLRGHSHTPEFTLNVMYSRRPEDTAYAAVVGNFSSTLLLEVDAPADGETLGAHARRLQDRLWADLAHGEVSGVEVLRDAARSGARAITAMPVTFASALHVGEPRPQAGEWLRRMGPGTMQTPQVWLDHQAFEEGGALVLNWDAVDAVFPAGLPQQMLADYVDLLVRLADRGWTEPARDWRPVVTWTRSGTGVHDAAEERQSTPRKADRRPDPTPVTALTGAAVASSADRIRRIWARMLGRDDIPWDASFLSLGGSSLTAIRLTITLDRELGLKVPVADVLRGRTIRDLAANLLASGDAP